MMEQVSDRIYVETGYPGTNVGLVKTQRGLLMIESPYMPENALDFEEKIKSISDRRTACLINTGHHFDHVATNGYFTQNTILNTLSVQPLEVSKFAAAERIEKAIASDAPQRLKDAVKKMEIPRPHIVFADQLLNRLLGFPPGGAGQRRAESRSATFSMVGHCSQQTRGRIVGNKSALKFR